MRWLACPSRAFSGLALIVAISLTHCLLYSSACLAALINVEPDLFPVGTDIRNKFEGVTLSVNGQPGAPVLSLVGDGGCGGICSSTGTQVFSGGPNNPHWQFALAEFRADFATATGFVSIDFVGVDDGDVKAEIYDLDGILLASFLTHLGAEGDNATATFNRSTADIAYILAGGVPGEGVSLDNLTVSVSEVPAPAALPLFVTGLGLMGWFAWRKKAKVVGGGNDEKDCFIGGDAACGLVGARRHDHLPKRRSGSHKAMGEVHRRKRCHSTVTTRVRTALR